MTEIVWADASIASRSGRMHPLAEQSERIARATSFSDPLDFGYLERAGGDVGRGVREALASGLPVDRVVGALAAMWTQL